ncbi:sigma-70 family RNA polymerase sigma factor [Halobacteriovorax marinus]|uniref:sigma-70 family RNA polymerase sigma factor n=1 Tax=Halobacteriovorax marinus TaxID=97084 RepID=UPI0012FE31E9|nr:sigma-70 family RNA polymerase sigma factor [Halobacteriovorax marinus]
MINVLMTEEKLISDIALKRDKSSFAQIYRIYHPKIFHTYMKSGLSKEESLELAQEVMLKIWRFADQFDEKKGKLSTWIFQIVRNTKFDFFRKKGSDPLAVEASEVYADELLSNEELEDNFVKEYHRMETRVLINSLPIEQQRVVNLVYGEGLSHSECALKENIPLGTVKSRIRLAVASIRNGLEEV